MPDDPQKVPENPTNTGGSPDPLRFTPDEINAPGGWGGDAEPSEITPKPDADLTPKPDEEPPLTEEEPKPEEEEEGDKPKPEADEVFDPEKLSPAARAEFDKLKSAADRVQELEGRLSTQGRELSAAKKAVEEKVKTHEEVLKVNENDFNNAYADTVAYARRKELEANELESQAEDAQAQGDHALAEQLHAESIKARNEFVRFDLKKTRIQQSYDGWYQHAVITHAREIEAAFLDTFPEFKPVKDSFDAFCNDVDANPLAVKQDIDRLHRMYRRCLQSERGKDENIAKIKKDSDALALSLARQKNAASGPDVGSSARPTSKKKEEEDDWTKKHFPNHDLPDSPADFKRSVAAAK